MKFYIQWDNMSFLNEKCPCGSGLKYKKCCYPFHQGKKAPDALILMKSRYSAYSFLQPTYIEKTTYKIEENLEEFRTSVLDFSKNTSFERLNILNFEERGNEAFVTFHAKLSSNGNDISFTEKSHFIKENKIWYYIDGTILEPSNFPK